MLVILSFIVVNCTMQYVYFTMYLHLDFILLVDLFFMHLNKLYSCDSYPQDITSDLLFIIYCYFNYCDTYKSKTFINRNLNVLITLTLTGNVHLTVSDKMRLQTSCNIHYLQNLHQNVLFSKYYDSLHF